MTSSRFIGRSRELAELEAAIQDASDGRPSLAFIAGESGVGKTRLLNELERRALTVDARVLTGDCVALGEDELPYAPIVAALRSLTRDGDPVLDELPVGHRADELRLQRVEHRALTRKHETARFWKRHPAGLLHLGEGLSLAALWRPFELEVNTGDRLRIEIALYRECLDKLAARLTNAAEGSGSARQADADLFLELAQSRFDRRFPWLDHALGDHPCADVLVPPKRTAGLHEQNFELVRSTAIEENARAGIDPARSWRCA